jgi:hypothetical protein
MPPARRCRRDGLLVALRAAAHRAATARRFLDFLEYVQQYEQIVDSQLDGILHKKFES